jgi:acyl-ACP thioesterase
VELTELVGEPGSGRIFERTLTPGIADGIGDMRIRLDAIARWLQDVAYADLIDAGFEQEGIWIVRRVRMRVRAFPRFGEEVTLRTFCSGVGRFSAERRTSVRGATGHVDAVALWIWIDAGGEPARFPDRFVSALSIKPCVDE